MKEASEGFFQRQQGRGILQQKMHQGKTSHEEDKRGFYEEGILEGLFIRRYLERTFSKDGNCRTSRG